MTPRTVTATRFKAELLRLIDEVEESGQPLIVTKRGRPVVSVQPVKSPSDLRGSVQFNLSDEELVTFSMGRWDVESE